MTILDRLIDRSIGPEIVARGQASDVHHQIHRRPFRLTSGSFHLLLQDRDHGDGTSSKSRSSLLMLFEVDKFARLAAGCRGPQRNETRRSFPDSDASRFTPLPHLVWRFTLHVQLFAEWFGEPKLSQLCLQILRDAGHQEPA